MEEAAAGDAGPAARGASVPIGSPDEKKHKVSGEVLKASVSSAVSQMKEMKKNTLSSFLGVQTSVRAIVSEDKVADEFKTTLRQDFMAAVTAYTKSEEMVPPSKDANMTECVLQVLAHQIKVPRGSTKVAAMWDYLLRVSDPVLVSIINGVTEQFKFLPKCTHWVQYALDDPSVIWKRATDQTAQDALQVCYNPHAFMRDTERTDIVARLLQTSVLVYMNRNPFDERLTYDSDGRPRRARTVTPPPVAEGRSRAETLPTLTMSADSAIADATTIPDDPARPRSVSRPSERPPSSESVEGRRHSKSGQSRSPKPRKKGDDRKHRKHRVVEIGELSASPSPPPPGSGEGSVWLQRSPQRSDPAKPARRLPSPTTTQLEIDVPSSPEFGFAFKRRTIHKIKAGSSAEVADVRRGDVIVKINGVSVVHLQDAEILALISSDGPPRGIRLTVERAPVEDNQLLHPSSAKPETVPIGTDLAVKPIDNGEVWSDASLQAGTTTAAASSSDGNIVNFGDRGGDVSLSALDDMLNMYGGVSADSGSDESGAAQTVPEAVEVDPAAGMDCASSPRPAVDPHSSDARTEASSPESLFGVGADDPVNSDRPQTVYDPLLPPYGPAETGPHESVSELDGMVDPKGRLTPDNDAVSDVSPASPEPTVLLKPQAGRAADLFKFVPDETSPEPRSPTSPKSADATSDEPNPFEELLRSVSAARATGSASAGSTDGRSTSSPTAESLLPELVDAELTLDATTGPLEEHAVMEQPNPSAPALTAHEQPAEAAAAAFAAAAPTLNNEDLAVEEQRLQNQAANLSDLRAMFPQVPVTTLHEIVGSVSSHGHAIELAAIVSDVPPPSPTTSRPASPSPGPPQADASPSERSNEATTRLRGTIHVGKWGGNPEYKVVILPFDNLEVSPIPINQQAKSWKDTFAVEVTGRQLKVWRTDSGTTVGEWTQDLVLQYRQLPATATSTDPGTPGDNGGMVTLPEDVFDERRSQPRTQGIRDVVHQVGVDALTGIQSVLHQPHALFDRIRANLPVPKAEESDDGEDVESDDGFELLSAEDGTGEGDGTVVAFNEIEWLNLLSRISEYRPNVKFDSQQGQCAQCDSLIPIVDPDDIESYARWCDYTGGWYCTACHRGDTAVIPSFVLHMGDASLRRVCRKAKQLLEIVSHEPIFTEKMFEFKLPPLDDGEEADRLEFVLQSSTASALQPVGDRRSMITLNDNVVVHSGADPGHHIAVVNPFTGAVIKKGIFRTPVVGTSSDSSVAITFTNFLDTVDTGDIVCSVVHGQGLTKKCAALQTAFCEATGSRSAIPGSRHAHAVIGVKRHGGLKELVTDPPSLMSREGATARIQYTISEPLKQVAGRAKIAVHRIQSTLREISETRKSLVRLKSRMLRCPRVNETDLRKKLWPREYLWESDDLFTLQDITEVTEACGAALEGTQPRVPLMHRIKALVVEFQQHVSSCPRSSCGCKP